MQQIGHYCTSGVDDIRCTLFFETQITYSPHVNHVTFTNIYWIRRHLIRISLIPSSTMKCNYWSIFLSRRKKYLMLHWLSVNAVRRTTNKNNDISWLATPIPPSYHKWHIQNASTQTAKISNRHITSNIERKDYCYICSLGTSHREELWDGRQETIK